MLEHVAETILRYSMFERGHKVGVAVSGGADSVCLLHVLLELGPRWVLKLSVLHLDHQLRGEESRQDAEFVRQTAARLGLMSHIRETDVRLLRAGTGENLEQTAREARREFFLDCLSSGLVDRVALGHTRSDQAETVLFRLLRGCGSGGLAGILPVTREGFVRPLIGVDRVEVEQYLRARRIPWREDSSNRSPAHARNRIRHELLPALARDWNPSLSRTLAHMATLAQDEEKYWDEEIGRLAEIHLTRKAGVVLFRAESLRQMARPLARRLVRRAIQDVKGDLRRIEFTHVEDVLRLAEQRDGHRRIQIPGLDVTRSFDWIRLAPPDTQGRGWRGFRVPLSVPGTVEVPTSGFRLNLEICEGVSAWNQKDSGLAWERLPGPIELRNWKPGDRYRPIGHSAPEKLGVLFQKHRIPLWERRDWPIIISGEAILWARQFGPAAEYAAGADSRLVVRIRETQDLTSSGNQGKGFKRLND